MSASNRDISHLQETDSIQDAFSALVSGGKSGYKTIIEKKTEFVKCDVCGQHLEGGEKFCPECGNMLRKK